MSESDPVSSKATKAPVDPADRYPKLRSTFKIGSILMAIVLGATGVFGFTFAGIALSSYLVSFWVIMFSPLLILAELRNQKVRSYFHFMSFRTGRGLTFCFLGSLTIGIAAVLGIVVGIALILWGLATIWFASWAKKNAVDAPKNGANDAEAGIQKGGRV